MSLNFPQIVAELLERESDRFNQPETRVYSELVNAAARIMLQAAKCYPSDCVWDSVYESATEESVALMATPEQTYTANNNAEDLP